VSKIITIGESGPEYMLHELTPEQYNDILRRSLDSATSGDFVEFQWRDWRCQYCGGVNPKDRYTCTGCSAPKG